MTVAERPALHRAPPAAGLPVLPAPGGAGYWVAVVLLGLVGVAGLVALVLLARAGVEPRAPWGYVAAALAFVLSTFQSAPALALASRLGRGFWGIPLRRAADLGGLAGVVTTPLFVAVLLQLPDQAGRPSIWQGWPGAPALWDAVALTLLTLTGIALAYLGGLPDFRRRGMSRLALGWTGTTRQWQVLPSGLIALGSLYLMLLVFVHLLVVSDLALSLVPGWHSAIIPPYHALSGLAGGVAVTVLMLAALRRFGDLRAAIGRAPFHACAKLILSLALLWFYFVWAEFLTYWYGRMPEEQALIDLFLFGTGLPLFVTSALLNFILPVVLLIWNAIRGSIAGATLAAALVFVGMFVDRIRLYVGAWSVAGPVSDHLVVPGALPAPGLLETLVLLGVPALAVCLLLLALRLAPGVAGLELGYARLLHVERPYARTRVSVIAKPS